MRKLQVGVERERCGTGGVDIGQTNKREKLLRVRGSERGCWTVLEGEMLPLTKSRTFT